jgi:hypothetical protein
MGIKKEKETNKKLYSEFRYLSSYVRSLEYIFFLNAATGNSNALEERCEDDRIERETKRREEGEKRK